MKPAILQSLLIATWRRQRRVTAVQVACYGVTMLVAALAVALVLDAAFGLSVTGLVFLDAALLAIMIVAIGRVIHTHRAPVFDARSMAVWIERRAAIADNALITAVEIAATGLPHELGEMAITRGNQVAARLQPAQLVDTAPSWRAIRVALCVALLAVVAMAGLPHGFAIVAAGVPRLAMPWADHPSFTQLRFTIKVNPTPLPRGASATVTAKVSSPDGALPTMADLVWLGDRVSRTGMIADTAQPGIFRLPIERAVAGEFFIDTAQGRSRKYRLDANAAPLVINASVRLEPPAYAQQSPRTIAINAADEITAMVGTRATIMIEANETLKGGALAVRSSATTAAQTEVMAVDPASANRASVELILTHDVEVSVSATANDGRASAPLGLRLRVVPDRSPTVSIATPGDGAATLEGWPIDVVLTVQDDVGLKDVALSVRLNATTQPAPPMAVTRNRQDDWTGNCTLIAGTLGTKAGDVLELRGQAMDGHEPIAQRGESAAVRVRIVNAEEYARTARAMYTRDAALAEVRRLRSVLQRLAAQRERLMGLMQAAGKNARESVAVGDEAGREAGRLARDSAEAAAWMRRRAAGPSPRVFRFEQAYGETLETEAKRLEEWASAAREMLDQSEDGMTSAMSRAAAQRLASLSGSMTDGSAMMDAAQDAIERDRELASSLASASGMSNGTASGSAGGVDQQRLLGPHTLGPPTLGGDSLARNAMREESATSGSGSGRSGESRAGAGDHGRSGLATGGVERITASSTQRGGAIEPVLTGVPKRYAEQAASYFRRLADESR